MSHPTCCEGIVVTFPLCCSVMHLLKKINKKGGMFHERLWSRCGWLAFQRVSGRSWARGYYVRFSLMVLLAWVQDLAPKLKRHRSYETPWHPGETTLQSTRNIVLSTPANTVRSSLIYKNTRNGTNLNRFMKTMFSVLQRHRKKTILLHSCSAEC